VENLSRNIAEFIKDLHFGHVGAYFAAAVRLFLHGSMDNKVSKAEE